MSARTREASLVFGSVDLVHSILARSNILDICKWRSLSPEFRKAGALVLMEQTSDVFRDFNREIKHTHEFVNEFKECFDCDILSRALSGCGTVPWTLDSQAQLVASNPATLLQLALSYLVKAPFNMSSDRRNWTWLDSPLVVPFFFIKRAEYLKFNFLGKPILQALDLSFECESLSLYNGCYDTLTAVGREQPRDAFCKAKDEDALIARIFKKVVGDEAGVDEYPEAYDDEVRSILRWSVDEHCGDCVPRPLQKCYRDKRETQISRLQLCLVHRLMHHFLLSNVHFLLSAQSARLF